MGSVIIKRQAGPSVNRQLSPIVIGRASVTAAQSAAISLNTTHRETTGSNPHETKAEQISGTVANTGNVSGAITIDLEDGDYHKLTAVGNITSITIDNTPTGSWGIIIEATNWGAYTVTLGSIEVPGGSITFTTSGTDKLVLSGEGTNASLSVAQLDIS